jgi:hypothetical protein
VSCIASGAFTVLCTAGVLQAVQKDAYYCGGDIAPNASQQPDAIKSTFTTFDRFRIFSELIEQEHCSSPQRQQTHLSADSNQSGSKMTYSVAGLQTGVIMESALEALQAVAYVDTMVCTLYLCCDAQSFKLHKTHKTLMLMYIRSERGD